LEPAETKAFLELLETDEAVVVAAEAILTDFDMPSESETAAVDGESESLDSFELPASKNSAVDLDSPSVEAQGVSPTISVPEITVESSPGSCLTIAEDVADDEAADILHRDVSEYSGIEGDDGYVFDDEDAERDADVPESSDDDDDDDDEDVDDDDSNASFGSNPFRR